MLVFIRILSETVLIVEGRFPTTGPPIVVNEEMRGDQYVPPDPFVKRILPDEINKPVFESNANTLRRTIVSDIL